MKKGTNSCLAKTQKKRAVAIVVLRRQPQEKGNPGIASLFEIGEQRMRFWARKDAGWARSAGVQGGSWARQAARPRRNQKAGEWTRQGSQSDERLWAKTGLAVKPRLSCAATYRANIQTNNDFIPFVLRMNPEQLKYHQSATEKNNVESRCNQNLPDPSSVSRRLSPNAQERYVPFQIIYRLLLLKNSRHSTFMNQPLI